jgi:hypothetical protein
LLAITGNPAPVAPIMGGAELTLVPTGPVSCASRKFPISDIVSAPVLLAVNAVHEVVKNSVIAVSFRKFIHLRLVIGFWVKRSIREIVAVFEERWEIDEPNEDRNV